MLPVFYLFHVKSRPAPCRRRFVFVLLLCAAAINGAWDAMLCSKVISAGRTKQEQNKREAHGQDLYLVMELGQDWSTVLLYYKLTSSVAG